MIRALLTIHSCTSGGKAKKDVKRGQLSPYLWHQVTNSLGFRLFGFSLFQAYRFQEKLFRSQPYLTAKP